MRDEMRGEGRKMKANGRNDRKDKSGPVKGKKAMKGESKKNEST